MKQYKKGNNPPSALQFLISTLEMTMLISWYIAF